MENIMHRHVTNLFLGLASGCACLAVLVAGTFAASLAAQSTRSVRSVVTAHYSGTPQSFGIVVSMGSGALIVILGVAALVALRLRRSGRAPRELA
jgi:hypothetical protein